MNLAVKDFGKLEYISTVLRQAQKAVNLIRNVDRLAAKLASVQGPKPLVLLNPGETRFCASIAMCARLLRLKEAVQNLVASDDWDVAVEKAARDRKPEFKSVRKTLTSDPF